MPVLDDGEVIPTYTKIKVNRKKRRVRYFGAVIFTDKFGKKFTIRKSGYLFIKDEPNTRYTYKHDDLHPNDKQKKKEPKKRNKK